MVGNLSVQPIVAPAEVIKELAVTLMAEVPDILLDADRITFPATLSKALTIRFPVYPVVVRASKEFVAAPTVH
jgi:hypothetical protein